MREVKIKERKNGLLEARLTINGKQCSFYGRTKTEVRKKIKEAQKEENNKYFLENKVKLEVALWEYIETIKKPKVKATTYDRVESTFLYHIKNTALGRLQLGAIQPQDIQNLLSEQCDLGYSISTIKKIYNLLGEFFRYVFALGKITCNPMTLVKLPHRSNIKYKTKDMEILNSDEVKRVISVAEETYSNHKTRYRYGEAIVLLLHTGMRSGEIRGLKLDDIDFTNKLILVKRSVTYAKNRSTGGIQYIIGDVKTENSVRYIPLNDRAMQAVKRLIETTYNPETGFLLCTENGEIVTHSHLQKCYSSILKRAGIAHMGLHSTRHSFATIVLKDAQTKGCIKEVSELLGHAQVSTTYDYYIKSHNEDKRVLINELNAVFS